MSSPESSNESAGSQRATDTELREILFRAKEERGLPALLTSQINEIGGFEYSGTGLNSRLFGLHEKEHIGHKKAAGRHMWWPASEGATEDEELPTLEELVDTAKINPNRFSEKEAREIAKASIPGYYRNWWQRVFYSMDTPFRAGAASFFVSIVLLSMDSVPIPMVVYELGVILGFLLVLGSASGYILGGVGAKLAERTSVPEEPWNGDNFPRYVQNRVAPHFAGDTE